MFNSVSAVRASSAWAVGAIPGGSGTLLSLTARWNGSGWSRLPSPSPGGSGAVSALTGVSTLSRSDAWAVGYYGTFGLQTLAVHWNGQRWTRVVTPSPGFPSASSTLAAVTTVSATDAWAVGTYGNSEQTLVVRWNGQNWTQVPAPSPGGTEGSQLLSVTATSAVSAWAVGCYGSAAGNGAQQTLALHWNGSGWRPASTPSPGVSGCLTSVAAISADNAWAAGWSEASLSGPPTALVLHWNGTRWTPVASPVAGVAGSRVNGVSAISPTDAWAVGYAITGSQTDTTLILHWNGAHWARVTSPDNGPSVLDGVSGGPACDLLAVGTSGTGTLALHWNGSRWAIS